MAFEACASGITDELAREGVVPQYLALFLHPAWCAYVCIRMCMYTYMYVCVHARVCACVRVSE